MLQNQTNPINGNFPQPLLMNFTVPSRIQQSFDETPIYDEINQVVYDMRTASTYSMKTSITKPNGASSGSQDKVKHIDDSKSVK